MTRKFRAFSSVELSSTGDDLVLGEEESHHLGKVLRAQTGASVEILDGRGSVAQAEISEMDRKATRVRVLERKSVAPPTPIFRIAVAMTKANRWEEIIRPLTEMGVGGHSLLTERTEVRRLPARNGEACEVEEIAIRLQAPGNPWLPEIDSPLKFGELFLTRKTEVL